MVQVNKKKMNTNTNNKILNPHWVLGFVDAEGCFSITLSKDLKRKQGYKIICEFKISQNIKSEFILYKLKDFFNCGNVKWEDKNKNMKKFSVTSTKEIFSNIIPFFEKNKLITSKYLDYLDFKFIIETIINKDHLNIKGLNNIIDKQKNMNTKRDLLTRFNYCNNLNIQLYPYWITGFIDGEGYFGFYIGNQNNKSKTLLLQPTLEIAQSSHDRSIQIKIKEYFQCGYMKPKINNNINEVSRYKISSINNLLTIIIPFLDQYPLLTQKKKDYDDWKSLIKMKLDKVHLTENGLEKFYLILSNMNKNRH